jgi:hypothetical protein
LVGGPNDLHKVFQVHIIGYKIQKGVLYGSKV